MELFVPLYAYPVDARGWSPPWRQLLSSASGAHVVVNVHDGPGEGVDPHYARAIAALQGTAAHTYGYVRLGYGERMTADVARDQRRWSEVYGVDRVFLDDFPTDERHRARMTQVVRGARRRGARAVVGNPGTQPAQIASDLCDLVVTRELAARDYVRLDHGDEADPARAIHLVHSCPDALVAAVRERLQSVRFGMISRHREPHPWRDLGLALP